MAAGRNRGEWRPAAELPVARVAVDVPLAHLDRPFDYRVPAHLDAAAVPGVRLRVRFAGRLVDGFLLERVADSAHAGTLAWVEQVVSPEPVLTAEVARAVPGGGRPVRRRAGRRAAAGRAAAARPGGGGAGARPRTRIRAPAAAARRAAAPAGGATRAVRPCWTRWPAAGAAHAVWQALPGESWAERLAEAAAATVGRRPGRAAGACPTSGTSTALHAACAARLGADAGGRAHRRAGAGRALPAVAGGAPRPGAGRRRHPVRGVRPGRASSAWSRSGTTATTCTPSRGRPTRTCATSCCCARTRPARRCWSAGFARTAEAQLLVESGWAREVVADRATVRAAMPRVTALGETDGSWPATRTRAPPGCRASRSRRPAPRSPPGRPVLVQVPRARLPAVAGLRAVPGDRALPALRRAAGRGARHRGRAPDGQPEAARLPHCRWCGRAESGVPLRRPAARAGCAPGWSGPGAPPRSWAGPSPGVPVRRSGGGAPVLAAVPAGPELVVATPGAEPTADGRVRRRAAARRLGAAGPARPAGGRGDAAALARRGGPGRAARRRRAGGGGGRGRRAGGAGPGALGPGRSRRGRAGRPGRGRASRRPCGWPRWRAARPRWPRCWASWPGTGPAGCPASAAGGRRRWRCSGRSSWSRRRRRPAGRAEVRERALLRVPRADGRSLAAALHAAQASRTARKAAGSGADPARPGGDRLSERRR